MAESIPSSTIDATAAASAAKHTNVEPLAVDAAGAGRLCGGRSRSWWWSQWAAANVPIGFMVGGCRFWTVDELREWMADGARPRSMWEARRASRQTTARLNRVRERAG